MKNSAPLYLAIMQHFKTGNTVPSMQMLGIFFYGVIISFTSTITSPSPQSLVPRPSTNYQLLCTKDQVPRTRYHGPGTRYHGPRTTDHRPRTTNYQLPTTDNTFFASANLTFNIQTCGISGNSYN